MTNLRRLVAASMVVVAGGCAAILGIDPPSFDGSLDAPDGRPSNDGATPEATAAVEGGAIGTIDPSFGDGGALTIDFGGDDIAYAVTVLPDGKILIGGSGGGGFALARLTSSGSLDSTFGDAGVVRTPIGATASARALVHDDAGIIAVGESDGAFALAHYLHDGFLFPKFGDAGVTLTPIGSQDQGAAAALQADKKIVVTGQAFTIGPGQDVVVLRYDTDGRLDPTFGTNGIVMRDFANASDRGFGVIVEPDGTIVVGGEANKSGLDFLFTKYMPNGNLDLPFGDRLVDIEGFDQAFAMARTSEGSFVGGGICGPSGAEKSCFARITANGLADLGFGNGGKVVVSVGPPEAVRGIALERTGSLIAVGRTTVNAASRALLLRLDPKGVLDPSFPADGKRALAWSNGLDEARAVAIQPDGRIVIVGRSSLQKDWYVTRYR